MVHGYSGSKGKYPANHRDGPTLISFHTSERHPQAINSERRPILQRYRRAFRLGDGSRLSDAIRRFLG